MTGMGTDAGALASRLVAGDRAALARVLTRLERDPASIGPLDGAYASHTGRAYTVGITGAPGAGKSTLVAAMLDEGLRADRRMAVLALDPRSPLTHGAILGDRMRMEGATADARVFVRSMTADPHGGGLSATTPLAVRALDAAGWPWIIIETVGVGQSELDVVEAASTTIVVLNPGWGDEVQAVKAGLMEVADVFVINKSDRDGAAELRHDLERLLSAGAQSVWPVPVIDTVASERKGTAELWSAIEAHRAFQVQAGVLVARRQRFAALAIRALVDRDVRIRITAAMRDPAVVAQIATLEAGGCSLPDVCASLLARL
jgi:LAO/AO transport system kinase